MSSVSCDWCAGWIEASNLRHPGFCCPGCRDADRAARQADPPRRRRNRGTLDRLAREQLDDPAHWSQ